MNASWQPGDVLSKRYSLEACLGTGSAAQVWRAFDKTLRAQVAMKLLHARFAETEIARRFLREARAAAQLRSLHVVQVLDHGTTDAGVPYIVMELLEGETLADHLERDGRLPAERVCRILGHVGKAATKAHALGIVHRDLKPENLFLVRDEDEEVTKVFDFGIAKITETGSETSASITSSRMLMGTPHYMSPEQANCGAVDHQTDLYAMGVVAFESLTGGLPFHTTDVLDILDIVKSGQLLRPSEIAPVPAAFDEWFAKATRHDPAGRFASAREQVAALHEALGVEPG